MKIGLGQISVEWFNVEANKRSCLNLIERAKDKSCTIVFFPEMTLTGFTSDIHRAFYSISYEEALQFFKAAAIKNSINIGFGAVEKSSLGYFNSYTLVSAEGEIISNYRKMHPFSPGNEDKLIVPGEDIAVITLKDITLSTFICYDLRFPEIFQLASEKAHLIVVPAAWPQARKGHWLTLLKARAIENQCYIACINSLGTDNNKVYYEGDSVIINPQGEILSFLSNKSGLLTETITSQEIIDLRRDFPVKKDRRNSLYAKYYL